MLKRDSYGIICQHPDMDGGDSAARMGISALENEEDRKRLELFIYQDGLVRHPFQMFWKDPDMTSRDQVVQFCVSRSPASRACAEVYQNSWFISKDFLAPDVRLYLYEVSGHCPPLWLQRIGYVWMWLSLIWNTKIKPNEEMNQFACMCIVFGSKWCQRLWRWHPNLMHNMADYWGGWRDQPELALILTQRIYKMSLEEIWSM